MPGPAARVAAAPTPTRTPAQGGLRRWVVTLLGATADDSVRAAVEAAVHAEAGEVVGWRRLGADAHELTCAAQCAVEPRLRDALNNLCGAQSGAVVDVVLQAEDAVRAGKQLAIFDLDSTLIAEETIDELAAEAGASERVRALTRQAMAGDLGFREALAQRVATLAGLSVDALTRVKERATYTPGAAELVAVLSRSGCKTAVVSGGFHFLADHVRDVLGLDYAFANSLETDPAGEALTGRTTGPVVDAEYKADTLSRLADELGVPPERTLAVGDGSNDVIMLQRAGLGVAFNAKPRVQRVAKARVNQPSLRHVLYLLGLDDEQIKQKLP